MQVPTQNLATQQGQSDALPLADELASLAESFTALGKTGIGLSAEDLLRHALTLQATSISLRSYTRFHDEIVAEKQEEAAQAEAEQRRAAQQDFGAGLLRAAPLPGRAAAVIIPFERRPGARR